MLISPTFVNILIYVNVVLMYAQVFSSYYNDANAPQDDQSARDEWVKRWSHAVGYNLCPLYDFFSLPLTQAMCQALPFTPYLPDDVVTQMP